MLRLTSCRSVVLHGRAAGASSALLLTSVPRIVCRRRLCSSSSNTASPNGDAHPHPHHELKHEPAATGYAFFEDQYAQGINPSTPTPRFDTYEEQMLSATAKNCEQKHQPTEHEKLVRLHDWQTDDKGIPVIPEDYGWDEDSWGPAPGEEGHNDWYKKDRVYMSTEEKTKFDMGMQCPVRKNMLRHQELPYQKKVGAATRNLIEEKPMFYSTKDRGVMANYTDDDKKDHVAPARQAFIDEWLEKPGVTPENLGKKISDYNGTGKRHTVKPIPRKPDWQLAPIDD